LLFCSFLTQFSAHGFHSQLLSTSVCEPNSMAAAEDTKAATADKKSAPLMPLWFIAHGGGPCFFMKDTKGTMFEVMGPDSAACAWYKKLPEVTKVGKPKAVLVISAHWETPGTFTVTSQEKPPSLLYDYYGFPDYTYAPHLTYPAKGLPSLSKQVVDLLTKAGLKCVEDPSRNFDHGVFVPLKLFWPDADVPIVQLSLMAGLDPKAHINAGKALASLREQGVLIIGSGSTTHDLSFKLTPPQGHQFVTALTEVVKQTPEKRLEALANWATIPSARKAHPREEHLAPLFVVAGAAGQARGTVMSDFWAAALSLTSFQFEE